MIAQNPIIGTGLHAVSGISASSCYLPYGKTKKSSWETYWLVQAIFAWLVMPIVIGVFTVPELLTVSRNSLTSAMVIPFVLGAVYGFGGMSFGYAIRHIGFSLTYTISIGISAVLGTITPLVLNGTLIEHFQKPGGTSGWACVGATQDMQIIRDLFQNYRLAIEVLGIDKDFDRKLESNLMMFKI